MKEPIRILHVLQRMESGGTQALLMNLYRNIDRSKVQFDFLVEYPDKEFYDEEIEKLGGKIYYTSVRKDYNILKFKKQLREVLENNDYKIIHVHAYTIGYFVLKTAKKCGIPVRIAHSHNNETVRDKKYIYKRIMQKLFTIHATDLFACSKEAGEYLFKNKEFHILNNAIDSKKFIFDKAKRDKIRKELQFEDNFIVGHVGRLHDQKNHKFLFKVFEEIKKKKDNAKLILIGKGPLEEQLKEIVDNSSVKNDIMFLGVKSNVNEYFMAMDVFVLPSLFEGLGIVAIESQAAGIPTLTADTLPQSTLITPLIKHISLEEDLELWANEVIEISKINEKNQNMQQYIIDAGYDISVSSKMMEDYYINKYDG